MEFSPNNEQKLAIETRDRSILLSAAAGSGKTATLTERILTSLTAEEGKRLSLDKMLIVTFTRAAAAELRERIASRISKELANDPQNTHLIHQTLLLGSADICTIDSFCLNIVKANFERLSLKTGNPLPPDFRLSDNTELKTLALSVMNDVVNEKYEKSDGDLDFPKFAENFGNSKNEGSLIESLLKYATALESVVDPDSFTKKSAERFLKDADSDFFDTYLGNILKTRVKERIEYFANIFETAVSELSDGGQAELKYLPAFQNDLEFCKTALVALDSSYERAREVFNSFSPQNLGRIHESKKTEYSEQYKKLRDIFKKEQKDFKQNYFSMPQEDISKLSRTTARELSILDEVISDFRKAYSKEKEIRRICAFSDIKILAHTLLVSKDGKPTDIALSLREKYDAVYIDEYQDVDSVQNEIFKAVSRDGVCFTVGDIKQSIYGFRGAEPSIFGNMRQSMPDYGTPESDEKREASLFMSENFRCDEPIIKFVNEVSAHTLVPAKGTVGYRSEDDLRFGKKENIGNTPVNVSFFSNQKDENGISLEVRYVVNEIKKLLRVEEKNNKKKYARSDIAVLCRSGLLLNTVANELNAAGISTVNESSKDFFKKPEILLLLALLTAIDNPSKDVPLAAAMRSPFFGFSMDELVRLRKGADDSCSLFETLDIFSESGEEKALAEKCSDFLTHLQKLRTDSRSMPVDRFIRQVYRVFGVMSLTDPSEQRTQEQISSNLRFFYEYARSFTATQKGDLTGFIKYINEMIETECEVPSPSAGASDGAVTLLTIHKSKGLEFPAVFVIGCGKRFNKDDLQKSLIFDFEHGVALMPGDDTGLAHIDTPQRKALTIAIEEKQAEEEMRMLYVALTRAKERLYITASSASNIEKFMEQAAISSRFERRTSVLYANSYMNWIASSVVKEKPFFKFSVNPPVDNTEAEREASVEYLDEAEIKSVRAKLSERFDYQYPFKHSTRLPAKLSVSKLYPDILDDDGAKNLDSEKLPELREKPLFLMGETKATAAEKGTLTHMFMQFCDFKKAERSVREELLRLITERFIPEGAEKLVNIRQLEAFFRSSFYGTVRSAKKIYRELRFNLLLPSLDFTKSSELSEKLKDEKLLVQGVIDLLIIDANGNTVLCDYKTDYLTPDELVDESVVKKKLFERHGQQLKYYAAATEQLLGNAPDRICIYSLPLGRAIDFML